MFGHGHFKGEAKFGAVNALLHCLAKLLLKSAENKAKTRPWKNAFMDS